jgi:(p)ppGpp synthase/HD superfamily hydrolase
VKKTNETPHTFLTERYARAVAYASVLHGAQVRKGTQIAYMSHLLGVSSLVIEAGGDEDLAIAGLLHDAVEDAGGLPRLADVQTRFGDRVADIVLACSDSTDEEWKHTVTYKDRKQKYLDHLAKAPDDVVLVSTADKLHNARAIVTDLKCHGVEVLAKFNGTPEEVIWYYDQCYEIAKTREVPQVLLIPLEMAIAEIKAEKAKGLKA